MKTEKCLELQKVHMTEIMMAEQRERLMAIQMTKTRVLLTECWKKNKLEITMD